jgi:hypothetical protein
MAMPKIFKRNRTTKRCQLGKSAAAELEKHSKNGRQRFVWNLPAVAEHLCYRLGNSYAGMQKYFANCCASTDEQSAKNTRASTFGGS